MTFYDYFNDKCGDKMKQYTKKQLKRMRIALIFESNKRTKYIIKHRIFKSVGDNFFFQPRIIPADPELIKFHNNVTVTSGVTFINHDIAHNVLNNMGNEHYDYNSGCIEVLDNVFIGSNSTILPNVKIGPNAIIAAGSVVTKDVPKNSVVAGVPARVISTFDEYVKKRSKISSLNSDMLWKKFEEEKGLSNEKN